MNDATMQLEEVSLHMSIVGDVMHTSDIFSDYTGI